MRALLLACVLSCSAAAMLHAQDAGRPPKPQGAPAAGGHPDLADTAPPHPLPAEVTTDHTLTLPGRTLHFKATAGAVRLSDAGSGTPIADIAYVAYRLEGGDPAKRPLTVAINGGPGAASAWLDIGGVGPWRLPVKSGDISPSMPTAVVDNAGHLARLHRPALHRSARHRLQPRARQGRRGRQGVPIGRRRHRLAGDGGAQMVDRQ